MLGTLVFLAVVGPCVGSDMFQRLNYGMIFQQQEQIIIARDFWYHTFELEMPSSLTISRLATCKRDNATCRRISHFLSPLDSVRAETAARLNNTIQSVEELIPET